MIASTSPQARPSRRVRLGVELLESRETPAVTPGGGGAVGLDNVWRTYAPSQAFLLHSNPGARQVIYMDFDGHVVSGTGWNTLVNAGNSFTAPAWSLDANRNAFSTAERNLIISMWREVAEDFAPFNIDVTTQDPGMANLLNTGPGDTRWGMRAVIGPVPTVSNPAPWANAGGIAFLNSFKNANGEVCFVWNGDQDPTAQDSLPQTVSHEVGHTLGLNHDGTVGPPALTYYGGHGTGAVSWGPIMGGPFGQSVTQWSRASYPGANQNEDDLAIISSATNGFGYRTDDYGSNLASAKSLNKAVQAKLTTTYGVIERNTDTDVFTFYSNPGNISIKIDPLFIAANLDIQAELLDASGRVLATSNPATELNASFTLNVSSKGTFYVRVTNTGVPGTTGYPKYGSIGNYRITGTVVPFTPVLAGVRVRAPLRWVYDPKTQTFSGTFVMSHGDPSSTGTGTFVIKMNLDPSLKLVNGSQVGSGVTIVHRGSFVANAPLSLTIRVKNPSKVALPTGLSSFTAIITQLG